MFNLFDFKKPHKCTIYLVDFKRKKAVKKHTVTDKEPLTEYAKEKIIHLCKVYNEPIKRY